MTHFGRYILFTVLLMITSAVFSSEVTEATEKQDSSPLKWTGSVSMQNQHYWRGMQTGRGLSFEAGATVTLTQGLTAGIWNGTALNSSYKEIDLYLTYSHKGLSVSLLDYYCPRNAVFSNEFSDWKKISTPHLIDVQLGYYPDHFPFSIMVSTMLWGDDLNDNLENYYSTYLEFGYHHTVEDMNTSLIVGYSINESIYSEKPGIVNIEASADYQVAHLNQYSVNCNTKFIFNPLKDAIYFGAGLSVKKH